MQGLGQAPRFFLMVISVNLEFSPNYTIKEYFIHVLYLLDYTPPSIKRPPPSSGAKLLHRVYLVNTPPSPSPQAVYTRALTRLRVPNIHTCVCTYVAQLFYSSIMSNNIKLEGKVLVYLPNLCSKIWRSAFPGDMSCRGRCKHKEQPVLCLRLLIVFVHRLFGM